MNAANGNQAARPARLMIVDDHRLFRLGLARLLRDNPKFSIVAEADCGEAALTMARQYEPDLVLMDLKLPGIDGIEATRQLRAELPTTQVVILTMSEEEDQVMAAMQAGALGYVFKSTDLDSLIVALENVAVGQAGLSREATSLLLTRLREPGAREPGDNLTDREREILFFLAKGASNKQIARSLNLSVHTIRSHITTILTKLNLENRVQAAAWAIKRGLGASDAP